MQSKMLPLIKSDKVLINSSLKNDNSRIKWIMLHKEMTATIIYQCLRQVVIITDSHNRPQQKPIQRIRSIVKTLLTTTMSRWFRQCVHSSLHFSLRCYLRHRRLFKAGSDGYYALILNNTIFVTHIDRSTFPNESP